MSNPHLTAPESPLPPTFEPQLPANRTSGLGIASLIVGGVALLLAFIPFVNYVSGVVALVGLVLGIVALIQKGRKKGLPIAGTIVSVVAGILSVVLAIVYTAGFVAAVDDSLGGASVAEVAPGTSDTEEAPTGDSPSTDSESGSRDNPIALGTAIELSSLGEVSYTLTAGPSTLNAGDLITATNQFNEPAPAGMQYALLPLTMTYVGSETGTPWIDIQVSYVGADGNTYDQTDTLVVGPEPLIDINEMFPDASAAGNVVIAIPTEGADQGVWSISTLFGDPIYFAAQ